MEIVDSTNLQEQKIRHVLNNLNCVPYDSIVIHEVERER